MIQCLFGGFRPKKERTSRHENRKRSDTFAHMNCGGREKEAKENIIHIDSDTTSKTIFLTSKKLVNLSSDIFSSGTTFSEHQKAFLS